MKTKTIELYTFEELDPKVQEKVIDNNRYINVDDDCWYECIMDYLKDDILPAFGLENIELFFSGFYHQGNGACIEATFDSSNIDLDKIKEIESHNLIGDYISLNRHDFEQLKIYRTHCHFKNDSRHYHCNTYAHDINIGTLEIVLMYETQYHNGIVDKFVRNWFKGTEETLITLIRNLSSLAYNLLEQEYEELTSDELVKECLINNELYFTACGDPE